LQFLALEKFHYDEHLAINLFNRINRRDVGMVQRRRSLRLDFETLAFFLAGGNLLRQEFDCDETFEFGILRFVNDAHAAPGLPGALAGQASPSLAMIL
jgi:hypothetical protein